MFVSGTQRRTLRGACPYGVAKSTTACKIRGREKNIKQLRTLKATSDDEAALDSSTRPSTSSGPSVNPNVGSSAPLTPSGPLDITEAIGPGVYVILDTATGKGYYGESSELCIRLSRHKEALKKGTHENAALQEAWDNAADTSTFRFIVLERSLIWVDSTLRKQKEADLILANAKTCFNTLPGTPQPRGIQRPIMINGNRYESSRDAARELKRARANILRDLRDPMKPDCYYLTAEEYGNIPVFAQIGTTGNDGPVLVFSSMKAVVEAKVATSTQMVRRRIQSNSFPNWRYAHEDDDGKPIRKPYVLKPGEMTYEQYLNSGVQHP